MVSGEKRVEISGEEADWLKSKIGEQLTRALAQVCQTRPADPIGVLAGLLAHTHHLEKDRLRREKEDKELAAAIAEQDARLKQDKADTDELHALLARQAEERRVEQADARRKQQIMEAARRRSEKEWRMDLLHFTDNATKVVSAQGVRELLAKIDSDMTSLSDSEIIERMDCDKDGCVSYEEFATYVQSAYNITVAPFEAPGHMPTLTRLTEEEDEEAAANMAAGGTTGDAAAENNGSARDEAGSTLLMRIVTGKEPQTADPPAPIATVIAENLATIESNQTLALRLCDRDNDGKSLRKIASDNSKFLDEYLATRAGDELLKTLIWAGYEGVDALATLENASEECKAFTAEKIAEEKQKKDALFEMITEGNLEKIEEFCGQADLRSLIACARNAEGLGIGHLAAKAGKVDVIKLLRKTVATTLNVKDASGRTAKELVESPQCELGDEVKESILKALSESSMTKVKFAEAGEEPTEATEQPAAEANEGEATAAE